MTTYETQHCYECGKDTTVLTYRVPEYTRSGETAANRGVKYSDGANADGDEFYNLDDGTPGVDAYYTGYHWTKSVCNACGTLNPSDWNAHCYNRNVYGLNPCDHNFFVDFDNTEYMQYNSTQHYVYLKEGEYCAFCKGTYAQAVLGREGHDFTQLVDAQLANNRFYVAETCVDCGYETSEYVVAKSVITSYYGEVDGEAHKMGLRKWSRNCIRRGFVQKTYRTLILQNSITIKKNPHITIIGLLKGENVFSYPKYTQVQAVEFLDELKDIVDYVIVDCSSHLSDDILSTVALIESDTVLRLINCDLKSISYLSSQLPLLADSKFKTDKQLKVANNVRSIHSGENIEQILGGVTFTIPHSDIVEQQYLTGELLRPTPPKRESKEFRRVIEDIAEEVFEL